MIMIGHELGVMFGFIGKQSSGYHTRGRVPIMRRLSEVLLL